MELNMLTVVVATAVATSVIFACFSAFVGSKRKGDSGAETLAKVTAVLREQLLVSFQIALELRKADEGGFEGVKAYVIDDVCSFVRNTDALLPAEKAFLSRELIERLFTPYLKAMWDYKLEMPDKNMSRATLKRLRAEGGITASAISPSTKNTAPKL